jgi:hypothetical protein
VVQANNDNSKVGAVATGRKKKKKKRTGSSDIALEDPPMVRLSC